MSQNISIELYLICKALLSGVALRALYDLLRISRRVFRRNTLFVGIEDTLYWIFSGVCVFLLMYGFDGGSIRLFTFICVALGMLLYGVSLSPYFVKYVSVILLKIKNLIGKLLKKLARKVKIEKKGKGADRHGKKYRKKQKKIK